MQHKIVSQSEWLNARKALLAKEKEFSKARDALSAARRDLPWTPVEKSYVFDGSNGKENLADLFGGKSQLMVYHFMLGPGLGTGLPQLLVPRRSFRRRRDPSCASRRVAGRNIAGAACRDRSL